MPDTMTSLDYIAGNTIIRFTATDPALLNVDAIVEEQDTSLLLGKSPTIMDTVDSFPALVKKMEHQIREIPGKVITKNTTPKRFIAIVYDIEHKPICEISWVEESLKRILDKCERYNIKTLAMPLLGTCYGKLTKETILQTLQNLLIQNQWEKPDKILIYRNDL